MLKNKILLISIGVVVVLGGIFWYRGKTTQTKVVYQKVSPVYTDIRQVISTTGTVQPQNRLEVKPPISGRIEEILVQEGDHVKKGQILAWMSSTERAALLDTARTQGPEKLKYWEDVYKATPLISPITGEVIVRTLEPGQSIDLSTPVVVLSDRLIIKAQVDETDIGKVKIGQPVEINLDAYPDQPFPGVVDHIAYEASLVSNVNIYNVDILPKKLAAYFRSGMGANVNIIERERRNVLAVPVDAVQSEKGVSYVMLFNGNGPQKQKVVVGLSDDKQIEIISGLTPSASVMATGSAYKPSQKKPGGTNPFMPARPASAGGPARRPSGGGGAH